jgi:hypothetical protein
MNADLTFNTIVFKKSFDKEDYSKRASLTRGGLNLPDELIIKRQSYTDSSTKVAGRMYNISVDRYDTDALVRKILTSMYVVVKVPETATQAQVDNVIATFKAAIADASLIPAVLNQEL